jgi:hypothetical protein
MSLSKYEKIRSKRERAFQRKVVEAFAHHEDAATTSGSLRRFFARLLKVVNSGAFLAVLGCSVSFGVFYHRTYTACVADSRQFYQDYVSLRMELFQRRAHITRLAYDATSIKDLRDALAQNKSFDRQFKEDTTVELQTRQMVQTTSIDTSGVGPNLAQTLLEKAEPFEKYKPLFFNGLLDDRFSDADLPKLKELAATVLQVNVLSFIADLRNVAQIECIPTNIFALMWGEKPITIRKYDAGSFVEREKIHQQTEEQRNHLVPMMAPPAFPKTTYTGSISPNP